MRFYVKKRRQPPAVIIVALIDILIVLLIFLMVTTSFSRMPAVKLALPESTTARRSGANESQQLIVTIDAQGNVLLGAGTKPLTLAQFKTELLAAVARNPELKVTISADKTSPFGQFVRVTDVVKEANIKDKSVSVLVKGAEHR
jgi:biopolymer transport protein ExbD